ncbi:MAG: YihA family ribosome biogenesis GTP-binding protein [Clostridia bacterium]|nr:YihA family ribosome biogenesis GTP-binding protein [Clostridia bacterium]
MEVKNIKFLKSLSQTSGKEDELNNAQIAIVGRSNVGKSSFINMLAENKKMAKTSSTPGRTRLINLFSVNDEFLLVDLPGYGYAKATTEEQNKWANMINNYLSTSKNLKACILLLDIRHTPSSKDLEMLNYLVYYNIPVILVATKQDKIKKSEMAKCKLEIAKTLKTGQENIIIISSETGYGKKEICNKILQILEN